MNVAVVSTIVTTKVPSNYKVRTSTGKHTTNQEMENFGFTGEKDLGELNKEVERSGGTPD